MNKKTGKSDALLAIQRIKEAEEKARRIILNAQEKETIKIIQDAYDEAKKIKEDYVKKARNEAEKKKRSIIDEASKEAEKIRRKAEEEASALSRKAKTIMPQTVEKFAQRIKHFLEGGAF